MMYSSQILICLLLDILIGDPKWYPHPVRAIGRLCAFSESITRAKITNLYLAGFFTFLVVISVTSLAPFLVLTIIAITLPPLEVAVAVILLYTAIAMRDLIAHSNSVYSLLVNKAPLEESRRAVGMIVGRDTSRLNEEDICRADIETVAENMVDGITAPLFYAIVASLFAPAIGLSPMSCSVIGAYAYKAVNTMDSMIAYKNERYLEFGRVAAKADDLANFLPARLSGVCIIIAAFFIKFDYRKSAKIFFKHRLHHSSPNAGHTEAAVAGALGLRFGGPSVYGGVVVNKEFIGESLRPPTAEDIKKTHTLVLTGTLVFVFFMLVFRHLCL